ncbi:hypothetical protein GPECTOR_137g646 [Gonium pectorale]|uniref:GATA-type domain-containing protein n=1 Tax=Gonium pectorale TaxID=33097 RepID=A0A150FY63_GONPE|nr:hypothetical protein GPECTOR_137g646 [Gonium pectorale]|eukprot:KXZ42539.1 hypothetical protein GPECTOR_137g646 [Gonium pectorale]
MQPAQSSDVELPAQPPCRAAGGEGGNDGSCAEAPDNDCVTSAELQAATGCCGTVATRLVVETAVGPMSNVQLPADWWQLQQQLAGGQDWEPESVPVSPAAPVDAGASTMPAAMPAAPVPAARAFHHKTGGPCDHCGATESPQWRRGPPAKPMLCNACGTRYRRTNQLNPASANSAAVRAAAAAAAAAAATAAPSAKGRGAKREGSFCAGASKRGRSAYY